jgi:hypothetical protein
VAGALPVLLLVVLRRRGFLLLLDWRGPGWAWRLRPGPEAGGDAATSIFAGAGGTDSSASAVCVAAGGTEGLPANWPDAQLQQVIREMTGEAFSAQAQANRGTKPKRLHQGGCTAKSSPPFS